MFRQLQIYEARERWLVGLADLALAPLGWTRRFRRPASDPIRRVLLLRLERIGDLLMVLEAIDDAHRAWPDAEIDLAVGSWNTPLAELVPSVHQVLALDVPWLARGDAGESIGGLVRRARTWRRHGYDLIINFEPDVRSNAIAWLAGAGRRVGYWTGGGGSLLSEASAYEPRDHVSINARRLVARAAGTTRPLEGATAAHTGPVLAPASDAVATAARLLAGASGPLVGVHASGGRESKQWHLDRFAAVARDVAARGHATIVLTGSAGDRALVDRLRASLSEVPVIDVAGALDLPSLAAVLSRLDVLVTGDTGPMHLAAAMGTPVVALFGPSNPARYGPRAAMERIIRIDLPCSPCGQVRLPPERCRGHVPDCLDGISAATVTEATLALLEAMGRPRAAEDGCA